MRHVVTTSAWFQAADNCFHSGMLLSTPVKKQLQSVLHKDRKTISISWKDLTLKYWMLTHYSITKLWGICFNVSEGGYICTYWVTQFCLYPELNFVSLEGTAGFKLSSHNLFVSSWICMLIYFYSQILLTTLIQSQLFVDVYLFTYLF